jgi:superfamily II DNA or RNA helicase
MMTTTTYQLRDYQTDLIDRIFTHWHQGRRRVMAQLPTGGGKTIVFSQTLGQPLAIELTVKLREVAA